MKTVSKPIFSVVMPMYNVEKFVAEAIESVLKQTYEHFELICVDDGCTDGTLEILAKVTDSRVRLVQQKNMGLAAARNTGIGNARGVYIALLDSDDAWHPEKLKMHLQHFRNNPSVGVSYSASAFMDEEGRDMGVGQYPKTKNVSVADIFCRNPIGNGSAAVIRHSLLTQMMEIREVAGGYRATYFDESFRQSEDIEFWLRTALRTKWDFAGIDKALTRYRVNSSGLSANLDNQLCAWERMIEKNRSLNPGFFKEWEGLARAYQLRYLARRAVQSRNSLKAINLCFSAMLSNWRIVIKEPARTFITFACAFLSVFPASVYGKVESSAMKLLQWVRKEKENLNGAPIA